MADTGRFFWGVVGAVGGLLIGAVVSRFGVPTMIGGPDMSHFGMPLFFLLIPLLFGSFWIVLIALAIRWLFNHGGKQPVRLADLPADFDDWHRRAHAQMDREAAARAGGTQP